MVSNKSVCEGGGPWKHVSCIFVQSLTYIYRWIQLQSIPPGVSYHSTTQKLHANPSRRPCRCTRNQIYDKEEKESKTLWWVSMYKKKDIVRFIIIALLKPKVSPTPCHHVLCTLLYAITYVEKKTKNESGYLWVSRRFEERRCGADLYVNVHVREKETCYTWRLVCARRALPGRKRLKKCFLT